MMVTRGRQSVMPHVRPNEWTAPGSHGTSSVVALAGTAMGSVIRWRTHKTAGHRGCVKLGVKFTAPAGVAVDRFGLTDRIAFGAQ